jgi:hypothetical protein
VLDWLARSDWTRRSAEFGQVVPQAAQVLMEFLPTLPPPVWELWIGLRAHPNILTAAEPGLLRYADPALTIDRVWVRCAR